MDFQQAFDTKVLTTQHIISNCALVQMTYANQANIYDIEFVKIIIIIFQPWTDSFYSYIKSSPQWAVVLLTYLTLSKQQNFAPVQLSYASKAIMHDIGFVETIFEFFWLWTVSSLSYKKRLSPVSSYSPDALNAFKMAKFSSSSNDLCQSSHHARYWVCRDNNYHFPTLDRFFLFLYKRQPPVSSCAPDVFNAFKTATFGSSTIDLKMRLSL